MLKLHGFAQSGNTFKVAFLLRALGVPFEPVAMSFAAFAGGATRDPAWREGVNEMGEVPVLELDDGRKITQSGVILTMLAEQHGKFGGRDADEKREILRWLFYDNHTFTSYFATWRFMKSFAPKAPDPAVAAELCDEFAAGGVDIVMCDRQIGSAPRFQPFSQVAVAILEERPCKERAVRHQFPSNTGLSLATKAR